MFIVKSALQIKLNWTEPELNRHSVMFCVPFARDLNLFHHCFPGKKGHWKHNAGDQDWGLCIYSLHINAWFLGRGLYDFAWAWKTSDFLSMTQSIWSVPGNDTLAQDCWWHEASSAPYVGGVPVTLKKKTKKKALKHFHDQRWYREHCGLTEIEEYVFKNTFYTRLTFSPPLGLVSGCIMLFLKILYINQNCINSKVAHRIVNALARESHNVCWNETKWMLILIPTLKKKFGGVTPQVLVITQRKRTFYTRTSLLDLSTFLFKHTTSLNNDEKTDIAAVVLKDLLRILIFWCMWFTLFLICFLST